MNGDPKRRGGSGIGAIRLISLLTGVLLLAGCRTMAPLPAVDLAEPGWEVRRGQAVWIFGNGKPEVVGDLVVASRSDTELFAQFNKGPMTVAVARANALGWELDLSMFQRRIARRANPDERFALFQLARVIRGATLKSWSYAVESDGRWRLENPRTGEALEGFWEP